MAEEAVCRACGRLGLQLLLSLGQTPLANAFLRPDQLSRPEPTYPLDLAFCPECALVQIIQTIPPEALFSEYLYFSSFSDAAVENARRLVERVVANRGLGPRHRAVEIASNDGYLLQFYREHGLEVLGIEPARNIARVAEARGIPTIPEFFSRELASAFTSDRRADVIHANNVLAHVPDLSGVIDGIRILLKDRGVAIIEVPYVKDLIDHVEFDTIYHEHLCYFSLTTLDRVLTAHGLRIVDVERLPIHGGSLRVFIEHAGDGMLSTSVSDLLEEERAWGVEHLSFYEGFAARVQALGETLTCHLRARKAAGERIAAYGASAKGSTLLNYFGIGCDLIDFVVDRSTAKQGHFTPGTHLPIRPPTALLEDMPDSVLLLTWNFADEILAQQEEYRRRGGKFIIPLPEVQVV